MLMISSKLNFQDGRISLYGDDIIIFPPQSVIAYLSQAQDSSYAKAFYATAKEAMLESRDVLLKEYKRSNSAEWICNIVNLYGQGRVKYESLDGAISGIIMVEDSFLAGVAGNPKPMDHILRGIIAGLASIISGENFDAVEIECSANGCKNCRIALDKTSGIKEKFPSFYDEQI